MPTRITEQAAYLAGNGIVDRTNKMVRNVKLCGFVSTNGREYEAGCLQDVTPRLEGRRVFVNHVDSPKERKIGEEFARILNTRWTEDGPFGDLRYYESCKDCNLILEIIEDKYEPPPGASPYTGSLGLSPVWYADSRQTSGKDRVTKIHEIESVDIVTFPATCRSIREHIEVHPMTWTKYVESVDEAIRPALTKLLEEMGMGDMTMAPEDHTEHLMSAIKVLLGKGDDASKAMAKKIFKMLTSAGVSADDSEEAADDDAKIDEECDSEEKPMEEKKKDESAAAELAKERQRSQVLMECLKANYQAEEDDINDLCAIPEARRAKWIKEAVGNQKRKALRSESPSNPSFKSPEDAEKEAIAESKRRVKESADLMSV